MARGSIPVPTELPVPRIWIRRRLVWRERRSGVMQQLKAHACAMVRSGDQGDGALHQRRVAREAAEERVAVAQLGDRHGERSALAAADDLAVREHPRLAGLVVVHGPRATGRWVGKGGGGTFSTQG